MKAPGFAGGWLLGIEPIIVLVPGHAFLGFHTDTQNRKTVFLETTMLNDVNNPFYQHSPSAPGIQLGKVLGTDVHQKKSWQSFLMAVSEGNRKYTAAAPNFGKQPGFAIIPVAKARESRILPLPI